MDKVVLTWSEIIRAASAGVAIQVNCLRRGAKDYSSKPDSISDAFGMSIVGQCGEKAVAKMLGLYWNDAMEKPRQEDPDLGKNIQVRSILKSHYRCLVKDHDNDEHIIVCVYPELPVVHILGCIPVKEAKRPEWRTDLGRGSRGMYAVPQEHLRPITEYFHRNNE